MNLNCLPILLLELSQFECVFNTLPNLLTRVHNRQIEKCDGLERNQMVLKEPYTSLIMTVLPVYLIKIGVMVLKELQDPLLFAVC